MIKYCIILDNMLKKYYYNIICILSWFVPALILHSGQDNKKHASRKHTLFSHLGVGAWPHDDSICHHRPSSVRSSGNRTRHAWHIEGHHHSKQRVRARTVQPVQVVEDHENWYKVDFELNYSLISSKLKSNQIQMS